MKRLLVAFGILVAGAGLVGALHVTTFQLERQAAEKRQALVEETQVLAQAKIQLTSVTEQVRELERKLELEQAAAGSRTDDTNAIVPGSAHLSAAQSERLLAEMGFNWGNSNDYLIVSKDTLRAISLDAMRGSKLKNTVCQVLAITPEERAGIEAATQGLMENYKAWAEAHVQREEPSGRQAG